MHGAGLCWGSAPNAELLELAAAAAHHGFPEIAVTPGQYLRAGLPDADIRARLAALGVSVGVIDALMSPLPGIPHPEDVREEWREPFGYSVDDCLAAGVGLGARTVNMAHFLGTPAPLDDMAGAVRLVAAAAQERALQVTLEFIPGTGIPDLPVAIDIAARTTMPNVGVMFDTWHFLRGGGSLRDFEAAEVGRVLEAQISDRRQPPADALYVPMADRRAPGEGDAPLAGIVAALRRAVPSLVLGVEVFTAEAGEVDATVAHLAEATRTFLARLEEH
jgi:sugar phosphate isomerase/epimerase